MSKTANILIKRTILPENDRILHTNREFKSIAYFNYLYPQEIISAIWKNQSQPDEITYRASSGKIFVLIGEELLEDITEYMKRNKLPGSMPYIHIERKGSIECYAQLENEQIISYIQKYFDHFDIYDTDGNTVRNAICRNRNILITEDE
jgi:nicotinic acid mononucleotide adenylyltransferase